MKEFYVSPEVEVTCFAPVEGIASNEWELKLTSNTESPVFESTLPNDDYINGEM